MNGEVLRSDIHPFPSESQLALGGKTVTTVLIVDDHPIVARYTRDEVALLRGDAHIVLAGTLTSAIDALSQHGAPDYILLDLMLPDCEGLGGLVRLRGLAPKAIVAIVSGETDPQVMRDCFFQGARGYLTKNTGAEQFTDALRKLFSNGFFYPPEASASVPPNVKHRLTRREVQVLQALSTGKLNKQLAPMLKIAESTYKTYLRSIFEKLDVRTRVEAVRRGTELGLIDTKRKSS